MSARAPSPAAVAALIEEFQRRLCGGPESRSMSAFADIDLTLSQVRMMMTLAYLDTALPIGQLAGRLGLTLVSAGRNVDRLLHEQLVERDEDARDRRVKLVALTRRGRDMVTEHFAGQQRALAELTHRLSEDDRARIAAALGPLLEGNLLVDDPPAQAPPSAQPHRSR